jgi:DNA-binding PadR family transcriptional regulator
MELKQTAYVILGILAIHPDQSGYEIRKTVQQSVGFFWGESYGQIYPTLKRLVGDGLIVPSAPSSNGRPGRQQYSITPSGLLRLQEWLAIPSRQDPPRDEFLLKLFFGAEAAPNVSIAHIRGFQERNRKMLSTLLELEALGRARSAHYPGFPFWILTLEYGVAHLRASLAWSEAALAVLAALESPHSKKPDPAQNIPLSEKQ